MNELTSFQAQAANIALNKLLCGDNFYISDLDAIAKLIGAELGGKDYQAVRLLHCVKWAEMPHDIRQQAREKIVEMLGLPPSIINAEKVEQAARQPTKLRLAFWK
jgi:hypothetical protein